MSNLLIANAKQILKEDYNNSDKSLSFGAWVKNEAEIDPTFFNWILKGAENVDDFGLGMTKEQQEAFEDFINSL